MFLDKKEKDSGLPDLPDRISLTPPSWEDYSSGEEKAEIHELPSFPDSPMKKGFSQSAIKDAINTEDIQEEALSDLPEFNEESVEKENPKFRLTEMEEWNPKTETVASMRPAKSVSGSKPVFVRIDKFREARNSLEKIKQGLNEIEDLLSQVREVKAKEDQELLSWEKEMENVKARISNITTDIFERVEI